MKENRYNMLLNTTHQNKEHKQIIRELVGPSFTLLETFKLKGVGSKRMIISQVSPNLEQIINKSSDINYANLELRTEGILIYINKGLENFTWVIPYPQLVVFKGDELSLHAQGKFVRFKNNNMVRENKTFLNKMIEQKLIYEERYNFQDL